MLFSEEDYRFRGLLTNCDNIECRYITIGYQSVGFSNDFWEIMPMIYKLVKKIYITDLELLKSINFSDLLYKIRLNNDYVDINNLDKINEESERNIIFDGYIDKIILKYIK